MATTEQPKQLKSARDEKIVAATAAVSLKRGRSAIPSHYPVGKRRHTTLRRD